MSRPFLAGRRGVVLAGSADEVACPRHWRLLTAGLVLVGLANFVVLLVQAPALVHGLYLNADHASALVLPALAGHAPQGSIVNLGDHPWYEPWWFMRATAGLAGYRELWETASILYGLLGIGVVTACAWWALGRLAGLLCGVTLIAVSESLRGVIYVPESHGLTILHGGVLCVGLLVVYRKAVVGLSPRALLGIGLPLVVFTGAGLTDQLLLISGLCPFLLAPLLCWLRFRSPAWRVVSLFAVAVSILSGVLALGLSHLMQGQHVIHAPFPIDFVDAEAVLVNLQNLIVAFASLGGGSFFGGPASGANLLTFAAGALALLALVVTIRMLWLSIASTGESSKASVAHEGGRELFVTYWGLTMLFVMGAFALTSLSATAANGRYLVGVWVAVAALLGALARTPIARTTLILGVALLGVLNLRVDLVEGVPAFGPGPGQKLAGAIEHFAEANGARIGYSGYWDASPVTWETDLRIKLYPIQACSAPTGWCKYYNNEINTWYVPRRHVRTFLVTDIRPGVPFEVTSPPAGFGRTLAREDLGEGLAVYVYDHDIASDLGT
jgi:hypothetical protein